MTRGEYWSLVAAVPGKGSLEITLLIMGHYPKTLRCTKEQCDINNTQIIQSRISSHKRLALLIQRKNTNIKYMRSRNMKKFICFTSYLASPSPRFFLIKTIKFKLPSSRKRLISFNKI
mgnify:CR=1 FL=1